MPSPLPVEIYYPVCTLLRSKDPPQRPCLPDSPLNFDNSRLLHQGIRPTSIRPDDCTNHPIRHPEPEMEDLHRWDRLIQLGQRLNTQYSIPILTQSSPSWYFQDVQSQFSVYSELFVNFTFQTSFWSHWKRDDALN